MGRILPVGTGFQGGMVEFRGADTFEISLDIFNRKFEAMVGGIERTAVMEGSGVEGGGIGELSSFFGDAVLLSGAELGPIVFAMTAEACFLELKVAQLFFVGEEGFEFDEPGASGGVFMGESFSKLGETAGVDGHFEGGNAHQPPFGVGNGLHEERLADTDRIEFLDVFGQVLPIRGGIFVWKQDRAAGETCFDGVQAGAGFALRGAGACRELSVGAICFAASIGAGYKRPVERAGCLRGGLWILDVHQLRIAPSVKSHGRR